MFASGKMQETVNIYAFANNGKSGFYRVMIFRVGP